MDVIYLKSFLKKAVKKLLIVSKESLSSSRYIFKQESMNDKNLPIKTVNHLNAMGFTSEKFNLYNFFENNPSKYLNDYQRYKSKYINGKQEVLLGNKMTTTKYLQNYNALPKVYGEINKGISLNKKIVTLNEFLEFLKEKESLMIKEVYGGGGKGIYRVDYKEGQFYLDDKPVTAEGISKLISTLDRYYISEVIKQADYAHNIYPGSVNTIRVLMMRDPDTRQFFIATAVHKFGSSTTGTADNVWRGGLTAQVDLKTGKLGRPAHHRNNNREIEWVDQHPDTGAQIQGVQIPNWDQAKEQLIKMSNEFTMLDYIGWDAVLTDQGLRLIEGNNYSEVSILQIHEPLLANPRVKKFYQHHLIVSKESR